MQADPELLVKAMEERGVSGKELADAVGVSAATISQWTRGGRACRDDAVVKVARHLRVDPEMLCRTDSEEAAAMPAEEKELDWSFRPQNLDGGRDYGNSNAFATPPDLPTFVRETGQNSKDAGDRRGAVHIRYRLMEISKDSADYQKLRAALKLEELVPRIESASKGSSKLGRRLAGGKKTFVDSPKVILLSVDDFGTIGLYGSEKPQQEKEPFSALLRNNLESAKLGSSAGGSFGLGKAVLWTCSNLSTVVFASRLDRQYEEDHEGFSDSTPFRLIGKAELPWHEYPEEEKNAGPGWLSAAGKNNFASVWCSSSQLDDFLIRRDLPPGFDASRGNGTSALVIGFRDPEDESSDVDQIAEKIAAAAAENFWPAIDDGNLEITVEVIVDGEKRKSVRVPSSGELAPMREALAAYRSGEVQAELVNPGDVAALDVVLTVPQTKDPLPGGMKSNPETDTRGVLVVRLASESEAQGLHVDEVAMLRGQGMVVKYWSRSNIVVGARPFHAVLLAGEAVDNTTPQLVAEQFLRLSEPPAHDDWEFSDDLRELYARGARQRIKDFENDVTRKLEEVIGAPPADESDGPPELANLLRLVAVNPPEPEVAKLAVKSKSLVEGRWQLSGEIRLSRKKERDHPLMVNPRLFLETESGGRLRVAWISLASASSKVKLEGDGFRVPPEVKVFDFTAESEETAEGIRVERCRASVDLRVERVLEEVV